MKYGPTVYILGLISTTWCVPALSTADEAFVVLEYNSYAGSEWAMGDGYLVQPGDTLARIVARHYGRVADPQELFMQIVAQNPRAFVGGDPNRLLSGVVLNLSGSGSASGNSRDEIYFF